MPIEISSPDICLEMQSISVWTITRDTEAALPSGVLRLLLASEGQCDLITGVEVKCISGDRMLLLRGPMRYVLAPILGQVAMTCIDIQPSTPQGGVMTLAQLAAAYPALQRYLHNEVKVLSFQDSASLVLSTFRILTSLADVKPAERRNISQSFVNLLLVEILLTTEENRHPAFGKNPHVRKVLRYLHENYAYPATAEQAARTAGIHPVHLSRLFKAETGMHIKDYLTHLRIDRAKTQLARTHMPIQLIATRCGFSNHPYFTRVFSKETGITPQEYRRTYDITCDYGNYEKHISREVNL